MAPDPCVLPNRDGERPGEKGNKSPDTIAFLDEIQTCSSSTSRGKTLEPAYYTLSHTYKKASSRTKEPLMTKGNFRHIRTLWSW